MVSDISTCTICNDTLTGKFCGNCGQPAQVKRVDFHYISHEVQHLLHFEKGFLYTIKQLLIRPGQNIKGFIAHDRSRLVKPVIFLIVTSLIYSTLIHFFHVEDGYVNYSSEKASATTAIFAWIQGHYGYANIMMGVFIAWWLGLFFKKYNYNIFELLILLCFVMGMGMLIAAFFALAQGLFKMKLMDFAGYIGVAYCIWAIGQFFDAKKPASYIKSLIAYLLGLISFTLIALIIGFCIDYFFKH